MLAKEVKRRAAHKPLKRKTKVHKSPATMVPLGVGVQVTRAFLYQMPLPRYQWFTVGTPQFVHKYESHTPRTRSHTLCFISREPVQHSTRHTHKTEKEINLRSWVLLFQLGSPGGVTIGGAPL